MESVGDIVKKIIYSVLAFVLSFALVACGNTVPPDETSRVSSFSEPVISTSRDISESSTSKTSEDPTSPHGDNSQIGEVVFDKEKFTTYFIDFANYFYLTATNPDDLLKESHIEYFLLRTSYLEAEAGRLPPLETNKDSFFLVPDESMKAVAKKYLGIVDLDLSKLQGWTMGIDSSTGQKQYSLDTDLPSSVTTIIEIVNRGDLIVVNAKVNGEWDEEKDNTKELSYTFRQLNDATGEVYYQLVSII